MGLLLVLFRDDTQTPCLDLNAKTMKRNSSNIITRAQSTISICVLCLFLTLLLFALSTFEPNSTSASSRRILRDKLPPNAIVGFWFFRTTESDNARKHPAALQGMGSLYLRGTKAMADLLVGHVAEDISEDEFRTFLRLLHRSGITAKADVVFIFPSSQLASRFQTLIQQETQFFLKLLHHYKHLNRTSHDSVSVGLNFAANQFFKHGNKEFPESIWGKRVRANNYNGSDDIAEGEFTRLSYGSVVGFEASELDPEDSLAGFLEHLPMSLRRWACYPMLLGRFRRNFKHVMLVDVKKLILLSDPLSRVRNGNPESVYVSAKQDSKQGKRNAQSHLQVNSAVLMGGTRGIRRFSSAMLTQIVRAAMQYKKKNLVTESSIISQLVSNEHILKNIDLSTFAESIPDASSISESNSAKWKHYKIVQRGNLNHDINSIIKKHICSYELESSVYRDC